MCHWFYIWNKLFILSYISTNSEKAKIELENNPYKVFCLILCPKNLANRSTDTVLLYSVTLIGPGQVYWGRVTIPSEIEKKL